MRFPLNIFLISIHSHIIRLTCCEPWIGTCIPVRDTFTSWLNLYNFSRNSSKPANWSKWMKFEERWRLGWVRVKRERKTCLKLGERERFFRKITPIKEKSEYEKRFGEVLIYRFNRSFGSSNNFQFSFWSYK